MGDQTGISWTESTWNPWMGCTRVSPGCDGCYMFREQRQYGNDPELVRRSKTKFDAPLKWEEPKLVFTCSWSDWFHVNADDWRDEAWDIIRRSPQHTFQILTKRPGRIHHCLPADWGDGYPNVWLGVSVESAAFVSRVDVLRGIPAALRFISAEPLLGSLFPSGLPLAGQPAAADVPRESVDGGMQSAAPSDAGSIPASSTQDSRPLDRSGSAESTAADDATGGAEASRRLRTLDLSGFGWIIVGGESGPRKQGATDIPAARPMHPDWAREIRDYVLYGEARRPAHMGAGLMIDPSPVILGEGRSVALHMKQWGSWTPDPFGASSENVRWVGVDGSVYTTENLDVYGIEDNALRLTRMRYAGPHPSDGGKLLDGVEWCEIPERALPGQLTLA
ncbi:MAG: DUF5131 family protein [Myxococcales bacterium]